MTNFQKFLELSVFFFPENLFINFGNVKEKFAYVCEKEICFQNKKLSLENYHIIQFFFSLNTKERKRIKYNSYNQPHAV